MGRTAHQNLGSQSGPPSRWFRLGQGATNPSYGDIFAAMSMLNGHHRLVTEMERVYSIHPDN